MTTQMTTQMTAPLTNLYDVLDVEPSATSDEIRTAWRSAVADLDPTDRRFRAYNQAAEVLLDPERRSAYDVAERRRTGRREPERGRSDAAKPRRNDRREPDASLLARFHSWPAGVPAWLIVAVAAVTAVLLGYVGVTLATPSAASVATDTDAAQAAAEHAIVPILSYDAHSLDRSQAQATAVMTSSEQEQYRRLFAVIRQNAPRTATVVRAQYVSSGVVRTGTDQVDVLVFVNQRTTNRAHPKVPVIYKSQVTMTMVKVGGQWLVDALHTNSDGS
jgi:Mce-associated membrane protein